MILQWYEFAVESAEGLVYEGTAEFGFFPPRAMQRPGGHPRRGGLPHERGGMLTSRIAGLSGSAAVSGFAVADGRQVDEMVPDGGPHGLGLIRGSSQVDPSAWFFAAHFMNDPVWPGSLGLESLLQLLKVMAVTRWGAGPGAVFESPVLGQSHRWTYRGQIVPTDHRVHGAGRDQGVR